MSNPPSNPEHTLVGPTGPFVSNINLNVSSHSGGAISSIGSQQLVTTMMPSLGQPSQLITANNMNSLSISVPTNMLPRPSDSTMPTSMNELHAPINSSCQPIFASSSIITGQVDSLTNVRPSSSLNEQPITKCSKPETTYIYSGQNITAANIVASSSLPLSTTSQPVNPSNTVSGASLKSEELAVNSTSTALPTAAQLISDIDPNLMLDSECTEVVNNLVEEFIVSVYEGATRLAQQQNLSVPEPRDALFYINRHWKVPVAGYANDVKLQSRNGLNEAHRQRLEMIRKQIARS